MKHVVRTPRRCPRGWQAGVIGFLSARGRVSMEHCKWHWLRMC